MENYIREIIDVCKLPFNEINKDIKVVQIGTSTIYICNFNKIKKQYKKNRLVFQ